MATEYDNEYDRVAEIESEIAGMLVHKGQDGTEQILSTLERLRRRGMKRSQYNLASLYSREAIDVGGIFKF